MMNEENISIKGHLIKNIYHKDNFDVSLFKVSKETLKVVSQHDKYEFNTTYLLTGSYEENKYGIQFNSISTKVVFDDSEGIINFLSGDRFPGIGKKTCEKLISHLGLSLIEDIEKDPSILDGLTFLTDIKKQVLINGIKGLNLLDEITLWLYELGLSETASLKLISLFGENTKDMILENPYIICREIDNIGFRVVDKIALSLGVDIESNDRLIEATKYLLNEEAYKNGNTYQNLNILIPNIIKLLNIDKTTNEVINKLEEINHKDIKIINDMCFLTYLYNNELKVSYKLKKLINNYKEEISDYKLNDFISEAEDRYSIKLTDGQYTALVGAFKNNLSVITGGPGTGKSTIVKIIVDIYSTYNDNDNILICAPTGRAAKRLCSHMLSAVTIHKALGYDGEEFIFNEYNKLPYSLIIVDESSMIDINLAYNLLMATRDNTKIIFLGDINQLPSVGPGNFLKDMIESKIINTYYLTEILRQKSGSNIITLANMVLNNNINYNEISFGKDIFYYNQDKANYLNQLKLIYENYNSKNLDLNELQIIIPKYDGDCGINNTNQFIQENFYKNDESINIGSKTFYKGDHIIETKNNYEFDVMNGDQGVILGLSKDTFLVDFYKPITFDKSSMLDLELGYAISVHKSQGNEFLNVILPLYKQYSFMLTKKLVYTAITRAKEKLIIIGDITLLEKLKENDYIRNSYLVTLLREDINLESNELTSLQIDDSILIDESCSDLSLSPWDFFR